MNISFLVPVFNRACSLPTLFDSLDKVVEAGDEIVFVDDGSTDNSAELLNNYSSSRKNIVIFSQNNKGTMLSRLKLIELSSNDYIYFVDSDDVVLENVIKEAKLFLDKNEKYDGVVMDMQFRYIDQAKYVVKCGCPFLKWEEGSFNNQTFVNYLVKDGGIYGTLCNKILKKELFDTKLIRECINNERMMYEEDQLLCFFAFLNGSKFYYFPKCCYIYYQDNNSTIHNQKSQNCIKDRIKIYEIYKTLYLNLNDSCLSSIGYECFRRYFEFVSKELLLMNSYSDYVINKRILKKSMMYDDFLHLFLKKIKKQGFEDKLLSIQIRFGVYWPIVPILRRKFRKI